MRQPFPVALAIRRAGCPALGCDLRMHTTEDAGGGRALATVWHVREKEGFTWTEEFYAGANATERLAAAVEGIARAHGGAR